ncbi:MAG: terpene cyclase/mutase family protein [Gemmataceae bacterium]|nr:terpene cyclase/mutase family protein [Gemmataceae bacterium]MDW8266581.1 terpene cyclase/mutase family protein [Gemmataceae bacterium]
MASQDNLVQNGKPSARPVPPVLIRPPVRPSALGFGDILRLCSAVMVSTALNCGLLLLLFLVSVTNTDAANLETEQQVVETKVEEAPQDANLENEDIGIDPDLPTNYNVPRLEDVSVPGEVNPDEKVGFVGAPEGPPTTVPPPVGFGVGHGAGVDGGVGTGAIFGTQGGFATGLGAPMNPFAGRSGATREQMLREGGGNARSEAAVAMGLKWLVDHQAPDGHWSLNNFPVDGRCQCKGTGTHNNDIAGTAFGLLPLLAGGQTHRAVDKNSKYHKNVERALKYLVSKQNRDGNFGGGMYAHGIATIAICEAYGLTSDPVYKGPAQRAINFIVSAQHAEGGGWRYAPKQPGDLSVAAWQIQALKSAQMSGLAVPKETLAGASKFLDQCSSPDGSAYGYQGPGSGPSAMTAAGLLCRQYMGWGPKNPGLIKGVEHLKRMPPQPYNNNMYYYYYATQVLHHFGGEAWNNWNVKMRDTLIDRQDQGRDVPHQKGSWSPDGDRFGAAGGRLMVTSLCLLTLEVYYRHLPLYKRELGGLKPD